MIKVENIDVWGFNHAIRGMRNPMNSWDKSDSSWVSYCTISTSEDENTICTRDKYDRYGCTYDACNGGTEPEYVIGKNDLDLMRRLYKAGPEHRKYLRQIFVSFDITAPLYFWKEFDTYKVGTTANSCSTMHKIASKPIELTDFSFEDFYIEDMGIGVKDYFINVVSDCEELRQLYLNTNDKKYWRALIQLLPESYNQLRTITMNYENVINMIHQRTGHKLDEWNNFVEELKKLPYIFEIMEED